jgi:hypothetical protein
MEDFIKRLKKLTISDLGKQEVEKLKEECRDNPVKGEVFQFALRALESEATQKESEAKQKESEAKQKELEAKLHGTYLEDCDGLWHFTRSMLPKEKEKQLELFAKISRKTRRRCYEKVDIQFKSLDSNNLPDPEMKSIGSLSSILVKGVVDIFNNEWNNERAHLIPDSPTCAPKWGHSVEGAFRPIEIEDDSKKNNARTLLVMGSKGSHKMRKMPQNFIKFAAHKQVFDVDPCVIIIPILPLHGVLEWEDDKPFEALVIASDINKPDRVDPYKAHSAYQQILHHFEYKDNNFCSHSDISTATMLIRDFLLGHAGSLAAGIPMDIDPDRSSNEKKQVLEELEKVKRNITKDGIALPSVHQRKEFRKVLKVRFSGEDQTPIPDPWLLAAKAAANLSSTRGQKLLPACKEDEEEDSELLQEIHEYLESRLHTKLPSEVNFRIGEGETPDTPPQANRRGAVVVTPPLPRDEEDDWENFGD